MLATACLALAAYAPLAPAADSPTVNDTPPRPDFAGDWEKDYARSDRWDDEWRRAAYELHRQAQIRQRRGDSNPWVVGDARRQTRAILAKARLADMASRQSAMQIVQTGEQIRIDRRDDAPLICSTFEGRQETFASVHGSESCSWERDQLIFEIELAEGTTIHHRFSLDAGGDTLSMLTRVSGPGSPSFDLRQFFNRYERSAPGFECVQTLTRGRVCSTHSGAVE